MQLLYFIILKTKVDNTLLSVFWIGRTKVVGILIRFMYCVEKRLWPVLPTWCVVRDTLLFESSIQGTKTSERRTPIKGLTPCLTFTGSSHTTDPFDLDDLKRFVLSPSSLETSSLRIFLHFRHKVYVSRFEEFPMVSLWRHPVLYFLFMISSSSRLSTTFRLYWFIFLE